MLYSPRVSLLTAFQLLLEADPSQHTPEEDIGNKKTNAKGPKLQVWQKLQNGQLQKSSLKICSMSPYNPGIYEG